MDASRAASTDGHRSFARQISLQATGTDDHQATRLRAQMKKAGSASELLALVDEPVDNAKLFNRIRMLAAWTKLAKFRKGRQLRQADARSLVFAKLAARLHEMLRDNVLPPREAANVFYAVSFMRN